VADVTPASVGQLSPDGRWRWDGAAWLPVVPSPSWATTSLRSHATWATLVAALLVGILADEWLPTGSFGLAGSATFFVAALADGLADGLAAARVQDAGRRRGPLRGCFRPPSRPVAPWPDLFATLLLLGAAASLAARGSIFDAGLRRGGRALRPRADSPGGRRRVRRPALVQHPGPDGVRAPIARGIVIAAPIAAVHRRCSPRPTRSSRPSSA
jgi:hypothetical protein